MIIDSTTNLFLTYHHHIMMEDPTNATSAPMENTRNGPRINGVMRRKVGTKTFPWAVAAINHTPPPQDVDIPVAKKPRFETSLSTAAADVGVRVPVHALMTDTLTTAPPSEDILAIVPRDGVGLTVSPPLARRRWNSKEDAKLTSAVKKHGNNWLAVAALVPGRNNKDCRQRWATNLDPNIKRKMGKWTSDEDAKLTGAIEKHGDNWDTVAGLVPGRTKVQCRERWTLHFVPTSKGKWSAEEDAKLLDAIKKCGEDWAAVAALVSGRTNIQCHSRWATIDRTTGRTGKWTKEEESKLTNAVKKHGNNWVTIAAVIPGRTNVQCRQRWADKLDPNTNRKMGKWTAEEDAKLVDAVKKCGKDWVAVAALVSGRTNVQCRQRWAANLDPNTTRKMGKWTAEEDAKLLEGVQKHGKEWVAVAALVSGRTNVQCCHRWVGGVDPGVDRGPRGSWKPEEDAKLTTPSAVPSWN
jgi:hypothetical protein